MDEELNANGQETAEEPRGRDYFWVVIAVGVIVVSIGAWFLGNLIAGRLLAPKTPSEVIVAEQTPDAGNAGKEVLVKPSIAPERDERESIPESGKSRKEKQAPAVGVEKADVKEKSPVSGPVAKTPAAPDKKVSAPEKKKGDEKKESEQFITIEKQDDLIAGARTSDDMKTGGDGSKTVEPQKPAKESQQKDESTLEQKPEQVVYVLQLGVYSTRENAEKMKKTLEEQYDLDAYISKVELDGVTKFRVQVGAFTNKANAQKMGRELQLKGYNYYISEKIIED